MSTVKLLAILLVIPLLAFGVSMYYEAKVDKEIQSAVQSQFPEAPASKVARYTMENLIFHPDQYGKIDFEADVYVFLFMKYASLVCAAASLLIVVLVWGLSGLGRMSRDWLVLVFPPAVGVSTVAIAVLTIVNGLLLVGAIYYGESALIGRVHFIIVGLVGLGALLGSVVIIGALARALRPSAFQVDEEELAEDHPSWQLVREVAEATGAQVPDVVVLGRAPTFFVYEGPFTTANFQQKGRLMYLSRDLSARLDANEVKAIIAHEFGHFMGGDLAYTRRFHFGYRALGGAMEQLGAVSDWTMVAGRLPALFLFQFVLTRFAAIERKFSRERELSADQLAKDTCGAQTFAMGLTKVVLLVPLIEKAHELVNESGQEFEVALNELVAKASTDERESLAEATQAHPFDTHPTLAERIASVGLEPATVIADVRLVG